MRIERVLLYVFFVFFGLWLLKRSACSGCHFDQNWPTEFGESSGNSIIEERLVDDFDRIVIDGIIDLELRQGDAVSVKIEAGEKAQKKIRTRVDDGRLEISMRGFSFRNPSKMRAIVTVRDLRELSMTGVGSATCAGPLSLKKLEANLSGVGKIELKGACDEAELVNSGAGNIDAGGFVCQKLLLVNSGVGNLTGRAEREIEIDNSGAGNVDWSGAAAQTRVSSTGVGSVEKH